MTYMHQFNWVVLLVIIAITAVARQYFILEHKKIKKPMLLVGAAAATVVLAAAIAPKQAEPVAGVVSDDMAVAIIQQRCASCHAEAPTDELFKVAPGGVTLESLAAIKQWAPRIKARTVDATDMPFMNKTEMTAEERAQIANWLDAREK
jgi:uncharacterized membrane protein